MYTDGIQRFERKTSLGTLFSLDKVIHGSVVSAATTDPTGDYVVSFQMEQRTAAFRQHVTQSGCLWH